MVSRPSDTRRRLLALGAAAPLLGAGCATRVAYVPAPSAAAEPAQPLAGTRWHYQRINLYNDLPLDERVCELESTSPSLTVLWRDPTGRELGRERYAQPWDIVEEPFFGEPLRYAAAVPLMPKPLAAGERRSLQTTFMVLGGNRWLRWRTELSALGWERIEVPAGSFVALRISRISYFEPWQIGRFSARRVETLWVAPEIGRWIRRDLDRLLPR
ncbi:MAG: hypothetical protein R3E83_14675 [Burkholderiaceae bacterium]